MKMRSAPYFTPRRTAVGLQQPPRGADVQRHELGLAAGAALRGGAGVGDGGGDDGLQLRVVKLQTVGTEGVGVDHVGAGVEIGLLHGDDLLGVGDVPPLGMLTGLQAPGLQQRAHAAIQQQNVVLQVGKDVHKLLPLVLK